MTTIYGLENLPSDVGDFVISCVAEQGAIFEICFAKKGKSRSFTLDHWSRAYGYQTIYLESKKHWAKKTVAGTCYRDVWKLTFSTTPLQDTTHLSEPVGNSTEVLLSFNTISVN